MLAGKAVKSRPEEQPDESQNPGEYKCLPPAPPERQPDDQRRRDNGAYRRPGVEDARGQRAFPFWEPFGNGFNGGGEVPRFTGSQKEARRAEGKRPARQRVSHGGNGPPGDGERVSQPRPQPIHHHTGDREHEGIGQLKREHNPAVIALRPVQDALQVRLQDGDRLPVEVIDRGGKEQQRADGPAKVGNGEARHLGRAVWAGARAGFGMVTVASRQDAKGNSQDRLGSVLPT